MANARFDGMRRKIYVPLVAFLCIYAVILLVFPLRFQAIESYNYASGAEGFYDIATTFRSAQPGVEIPNFSRYHPNHPLLHALAATIHDKTGYPALQLFKAFNGIGAIVCLAYLFAACLLLFPTAGKMARRASLGVVIAMAFSHSFWMSALSGEVYLLAAGLLMAAAYYCMRHLLPNGTAADALKAAVFAAGALALHLAVAFVLPLALAVFFKPQWRQRWKLYILCTAILLAALFLTYVVGLTLALNISSVDQYWSVLLVYKYLLHIRYTGLDWFTMLAKADGHALAYGFGTCGVALQIVFAATVTFGYISVIRSKLQKPIKALLLLWPLSYLVLQFLSGVRIDGINYWHFVAPAFWLILAFVARFALSQWFGRIALFVATALLIGVNFWSAVKPNTFLALDPLAYIDDPAAMAHKAGRSEAIHKDIPIVFLAKDPVLTFFEIYRVGSTFGYKNQKILVYCCGKTGYDAPLRAWMRERSSFFLVVDEINDEMQKILNEENRNYIVVKEQKGEFKPEWIPASIYFRFQAGYRIFKNVRVYYVFSPPDSKGGR